jgi:hypothetical protein
MRFASIHFVLLSILFFRPTSSILQNTDPPSKFNSKLKLKEFNGTFTILQMARSPTALGHLVPISLSTFVKFLLSNFL